MWSPGRGLREQHMGVTLPWMGVSIHSGLVFDFIFGGGGEDREWGGAQPPVSV